MGVVDVDASSFDKVVIEGSRERPVVVDFWAPWCGPCRALEPVLSRLEDQARGAIAFTKLNVDQNPVTASRYGVLSLPTTILFEGGEPRETVVGARGPAHYERAWATWLAA